jgi:competence protein ComEC
MTLKPAQHWQLVVRLKPAVGMKNPIPFDYESWLFQQRLGAVGYVRPSSENQLISEPERISINSLRHQLAHFLESHFSNSSQLGFLQALTIGIKHHISPEQWTALVQSGTNHLLAISGLHIGLAAAVGFYLFGWIWSLRAINMLLVPRQYIAAVGGFLIAFIYAAMAGFAIPTQRALIMVAIVLLSLVTKRPLAPFNVLALCLVVVLIWDPLSIIAPGFYLSFAAVAIILLTQNGHLPRKKWGWLSIHGTIAFGLTPLLIIFFGQTSLIAPIANLIAVPVISLLIVPLVLLATCFYFISTTISLFIFQIAEWLLDGFWLVIATLSANALSTWSIPQLPLPYWLIVIIGSILLLLPKGVPAKYLGLVALTPLIFFQPPRPQQGEFWFTLLDVGQGLSALIETPNHTLLFDTGADFFGQFNAGKDIVIPFLNSKKIDRLDTVIVSHSDNDHIGGFAEINKRIHINNVLTSSPSLIKNSQACLAGQSWIWDGISFDILHPYSTDKFAKNDQSCVLKVANNNSSVLLTGDIEKEAEKHLIARAADQLASTVLIAPHHGSKTSSTKAFVKAVKPDVVLFPVGYLNRFNHPHPKVVARYDASKYSFNTAKHGAIHIKFSEQGMQSIQTWRQDDKKIWTAKLSD